MSRNPEMNGGAAFAASLANDLAMRESLWQAALAEAESALQSGEAQDAERRAKALSAIAKAAADIAQWREQAMAALKANETEQDGEAFRRELELRIDRDRKERGLSPLFGQAADGA
jgi:recombinational DNA repair ATPase RecF